jgi:hypothetical protein
LFTSSKPFCSRKTKLAKSSHPFTELVVSLIVNNEENLLRALLDTGAITNIILEAYTSAPLIKTYDSNTTTWSTVGGNLGGFVDHLHSYIPQSGSQLMIECCISVIHWNIVSIPSDHMVIKVHDYS